MAAGLAYLRPHLLGSPPPPTSTAKATSRGSFNVIRPVMHLEELAYVGGALWVTYRGGGLSWIYFAVDGDSNWQLVYQGSASTSLQVLGPQTALVSLADEYAIIGRDGEPWTKPIPTNLSISYAFADPRHGLALLSDGSLYETLDGGVWRPVASQGLPAGGIKHGLGLTPGGRGWLLAGSDLYVSEDWGRSWRHRDVLRFSDLGRPLEIVRLGEELFASYPGEKALFRLPLGGGAWEELASRPESGPLAVRRDGHLLLAAGRQVYGLAPGASGWLPVPPAAPEPLYALAERDGDSFYAAGQSGALYRWMGETQEWLQLQGPLPVPVAQVNPNFAP